MKLLSPLETVIISAGEKSYMSIDRKGYTVDITNIPGDCLALFIKEFQNGNTQDQLPTVKKIKALAYSATAKLAGCKSYRDQFRNTITLVE